MASVLSVVKYTGQAKDVASLVMPVPKESGGVVREVVDFTSGVASSDPFGAGYNLVFICPNVDCWWRVNGTAAAETAGSQFLAAGVYYAFGPADAADVISVIAA